MTVLRAALLFDHPTTRLFASRILESFFCPPRSSLPPPPPRPPALRASSSARFFFRVSSPRPSRRAPTLRTFLLRSLRPPHGPAPKSHPLFHVSHLLSGSSVNKRTRAKEESKAFRPRLLVLSSTSSSSISTFTSSSSPSFSSSS